MSLLTPHWVAAHLFNRPQIDVQLLVTPGKQPTIRYRDSDILFLPSAERVVLNMLNDHSETLQRAEQLAVDLLRKLPHTPITGVGVNFRFAAAAAEPGLAGIFSFNDNIRLGKAGWSISKSDIVRRLTVDTITLNMSMSTENGEITFSFNFHTEVGGAAGAAEAADALQETVCDRRDKALALLTGVYELHPAEPEE